MVFCVVHFQYQSGQAFELPRTVVNRYFRGEPCLIVPPVVTARGKLARISQEGFRAVFQRPFLSGVVFFYLLLRSYTMCRFSNLMVKKS